MGSFPLLPSCLQLLKIQVRNHSGAERFTHLHQPVLKERLSTKDESGLVAVKELCLHRRVYQPGNPVDGGLVTVAPAFIPSALVPLVVGIQGLLPASMLACYPRVLTRHLWPAAQVSRSNPTVRNSYCFESAASGQKYDSYQRLKGQVLLGFLCPNLKSKFISLVTPHTCSATLLLRKGQMCHLYKDNRDHCVA